MKKIAIISLSLVLLVTQFSFAMDFSASSFNDQETAEEVLMSSPDVIDIQGIPYNPDSPLCDMLITTWLDAVLNLACPDCAHNWYVATISYILWALYCYPEVADD